MKTLLEKEVAVAEMLGAKQEQWYPYNKDTQRTGMYLVFPQGKWYPDNVRQHADSLLKFHSEANWQYKAIEFLEKLGYVVESYSDSCMVQSSDGEYSESSNVMLSCSVDVVGVGNRLEATFDALFQMSQLLKPNTNV